LRVTGFGDVLREDDAFWAARGRIKSRKCGNTVFAAGKDPYRNCRGCWAKKFICGPPLNSSRIAVRKN